MYSKYFANAESLMTGKNRQKQEKKHSRDLRLKQKISKSVQSVAAE